MAPLGSGERIVVVKGFDARLEPWWAADSSGACRLYEGERETPLT